jgi:hypothetical protein
MKSNCKIAEKLAAEILMGFHIFSNPKQEYV